MFGYAFDKPGYSDRLLRLLFSHEEQQMHDATTPPAPRKKKTKRSAASHPLSQLSIKQEGEMVHVSSAVIAKESSFFRAMFDAASFQESSDKIIDIVLKHKDREAFLHLLKYLYTLELEANMANELLLVWQLSERFLVDSCVDICIQRLLSLELSWHDSCSILEHVIVVKKTNQIKRLEEKSILVLANHFGWKNIEKNKQHKTELRQISPEAMELFLSSDSCPFENEDEVYSLLNEWIHVKHQNTESLVATRLKFKHLVRWPLMTIRCLKRHITQRSWDGVVQDSLWEALLYHVSTEEEKATIIASSSLRAYMYRRRVNSPLLIKCFSANNLTNQETVSFSISVDDWHHMQKLEPNKYIRTQSFYLCGSKFLWIFSFHSGEPVMWLQKVLEQPTMILDVCFWIWDATKNAYVKKWEELNKCVLVFARYPFCKGYICDNGPTWCKSEICVSR